MRFIVGMALSPALADWLARQGHDAVHASDLGLARAPDSEIIERARDEDRIVVTADLDYPRLLALARSSRPALMLFRGGTYSDQEVIDRLAQVLELSSEADLVASVVTVERWRIRKRRFPIGSD